MIFFDRIRPEDVDRREWQLTALACSSIVILALGTAILMYPLVFSSAETVDRALPIAFVGYCALSLLLAGYLWDRQKTIHRLRRQMADERRRVGEARQQASAELLKTMPTIGSFQDRLAMECRRTIAASQKLSVVVITLRLPPDGVTLTEQTTMFGDAAKAIGRKLRDHDSIYVLASGCFSAILPGVDVTVAKRIADRVSEGLADVAGVSRRFAHDINVVSYPEDATSAHELQSAVRSLVPVDSSVFGMADALN